AEKGPHMRLLYVHGNGGCAMDRFNFADDLRTIVPLDFYILEYPGYGCREGSPREKSLFASADEALDLLKKDGGVYVVGESLGTGVACYLAGTYPQTVLGMLLIAPYNNLTAVAQAHMPIFPVGLLLLDRFPSATFLKNYHGPVAMLFAGRDTVVPDRFGHKLYDGYDGPKKFWEMPEAGHGGLLVQTDAWWRGLVAFWKADAVKTASAVGESARD
ncbi:MAG TPA: alpha/beta fold hydrolase, partial [Verrucomicrobiae bacterium]|nr:alpha/beta fold hydrolase [Verrucomicrobiae bacterium]